MRTSFLFEAALVAILPSCIAASPIDQGALKIGSIGTAGTFQIGPDGKLVKRDDVPDMCYASGMGQATYWYVPFLSDGEAVACMMGPLGYLGGTCDREEFWPEDYLDDIVDSVNKQVTKDGSGKRSTVGVFTARWGGFTTAVPDRTGFAITFDAMFRFNLNNCHVSSYTCNAQHRQYFYKYRGETIVVEHKDGDCGGFLGIGGNVYAYCPGEDHCKD